MTSDPKPISTPAFRRIVAVSCVLSQLALDHCYPIQRLIIHARESKERRSNVCFYNVSSTSQVCSKSLYPFDETLPRLQVKSHICYLSYGHKSSSFSSLSVDLQAELPFPSSRLEIYEDHPRRSESGEGHSNLKLESNNLENVSGKPEQEIQCANKVDREHYG